MRSFSVRPSVYSYPKIYEKYTKRKGIEILYVYAYGKNACTIAADSRAFIHGPGTLSQLGNRNFSNNHDLIKEKVTSSAF